MKARILFPWALFCLSLPAADVTVASPDGQVRFQLSSSAQGHLEYTVAFHSKNIVDPEAASPSSPLGPDHWARILPPGRKSGRRRATASTKLTPGTARTPPQ